MIYEGENFGFLIVDDGISDDLLPDHFRCVVLEYVPVDGDVDDLESVSWEERMFPDGEWAEACRWMVDRGLHQGVAVIMLAELKVLGDCEGEYEPVAVGNILGNAFGDEVSSASPHRFGELIDLAAPIVERFHRRRYEFMSGKMAVEEALKASCEEIEGEGETDADAARAANAKRAARRRRRAK